MITGELRSKVDSIWDTIWTGGITSPITVLEQITYLMFMKLLDDNQLKAEAGANALGIKLKNRVFGEGICVISENPHVETDFKNLRWHVFHNYEPGAMFTNIQNYVFPFIKQIGEGKDTAFSRYMKDTVFLIPTAKVLAKVVDGIDAMDMNNKDIMGDVYEYLLGKIAAAGENGQFRTPRHIINMMVQLMKPTLKDKILDPAMGSAGFLLESSTYISTHYAKELMKADNAKYYKSGMFSGFDTDQSMLRIGAMNMMLHGVEDPNITYQDSLSGDNNERNCYSLIMANPPFTGSVFQEEISKDLLALCKTKKTELLFLTLFVKMLEVGGRCAGVMLDFVTNSKTLTMKGSLTPSSSRTYYSFDIFIDGKPAHYIDNFTGVAVEKCYAPQKFEITGIDTHVDLGEGEKRVTVYFPWSMAVKFTEISLDDGALVEPCESKKKLLAFGDSITHGYDAMRPSVHYVQRLCEALGYEQVNKGIGAEIYRPALARLAEDFTPDLITVAYGTNDWNLIKSDEFTKNCSEF